LLRLTLCYLDHGRTQRLVTEHVALAQLADDFAVAMVGLDSCITAWWILGSKSSPSASIRGPASSASSSFA
jgi:hypothetical protein